MWTKQRFVEQALAELGLAVYVFDLQPEQLQTVLVRLDAMVAGWSVKGIRFSWPSSSGPDTTSLETETDVPDWAAEAVYLNLAVRSADVFGKAVTPNLTRNAAAAWKALVQATSRLPAERQYPSTMPRGAGNKPLAGTGSNYQPVPTDPLDAGPDGPLDFN